MKLVNLTPHEINVRTEEGAEIKLPPSGQVARVATTDEIVSVIDMDGVPVQIWETTFGQLDLPEPVADTFFVVGRLVLQAAPHRNDLMAPGQLTRDDQGRPVGCRGLSR